MDIRDLMIGDYVAVGDNKTVIKVTRISKSMNEFVVVYEDSNGDIREFSNDEVHPIVLTKDMLIKNGFVAENVWNGVDDLTYHIEQKNAIAFEDSKITFDSKIEITVQIISETNILKLTISLKKDVLILKLSILMVCTMFTNSFRCFAQQKQKLLLTILNYEYKERYYKFVAQSERLYPRAI